MRTFIKLFILLFTAITAFGQSASISLSNDSICLGQNVTATAVPPGYNLATPTGTNNQNGVMFDVTASFAATITGFLISPLSNNSTYYVYYRTGSHVGHENSSTGWTLLDSVNNVSSGTAVNPGFNLSQPIVAGQTLAFYITSNGTNYMYYGNGTAVGNTLASDTYLTIKEGVGKAYPFGASYTPRNFVGSVLYSPGVTSYSWNTNNSGMSITKSPVRSSVYSCEMTLSNGATIAAAAPVLVKEIAVDATANPSSIQPGQNSTLTANLELHRGLSTTHVGGNSQNGAMFDVEASKPLSITGFSVTPMDTAASIEIFYKTGTHVGFEANSGAWTSIGTYSNVPAANGQYLALSTPLTLVAGQTVAFYISRTDGYYMFYTNGTAVGSTVASAGGLKIKEGKGVEYPFGTTFSPRILNTIVHYSVSPVTNAIYSWSSGGSSASVVVNPTSTTTYDVDVTVAGCTESASVTVTVSGVGLEELEAAGIRIFPNPTSDLINISLNSVDAASEVQLIDLTGKLVLKETAPANTEKIVIPVESLTKGIYLLKIQHGAFTGITRVVIL